MFVGNEMENVIVSDYIKFFSEMKALNFFYDLKKVVYGQKAFCTAIHMFSILLKNFEMKQKIRFFDCAISKS